jgi:lipopolysaccharide export system permease protein
MRIARTLSLYVMREALVYCALTFFVLTLVLLTQNLLRRLDQLFLIGLTTQDLRIVVECIFPVALSYSIPLAFLVGILLSVRRLGTDGELGALGATGIGPTAFLFPHLVLGLLATGVSGWLLTSVEHQSRRDLVQLLKTAAARGAILEPGKFREIDQRVIFIEDRDRDGTLTGVMILDQSQSDRPYRVFADRGSFHFNEGTAQIELELWNGDLHFAPTEGKPKRYERIHFEEFFYQLDVGHVLRGSFGPVRPKQMNLAELRHVLQRAEAGDPLRELDQRNPLEYELEIHRRRALPFAPLLFAGIAVPIALATENRGRSVGLLLVLIVALGYYALAGAMAAMLAAAEQPWLSTAIASWIPNILLAGLGLALGLIERRRIPA